MNKTASNDNKSVLMFCPTFFGYENRIANAIRAQGYSVDLYDERPNNGFFCKTFLRLNLRFYKPFVRRYINKIIEKNKNKHYDYVFVVKSEAAGEKELALLRAAYPDAEFILYFWDSVINIPEGEKKIALYDKVFTFDPTDSEEYGIPFLPLPYGKEYIREESTNEYEYDVAFIGTAHSVRPRVINQIKKQCEQQGRKCFSYFYSPHILVFALNKLINKDFKYISFSEVNFKPLSTAEVCKIYSLSKCVMDVEHPKQHGTTTRPVEMLPMKKKIITTNSFVKNFDFYNNNNFYIIDRNNPVVDESFFESDYIPVSEDLLYKYSPERFVEILFNAD